MLKFEDIKKYSYCFASISGLNFYLVSNAPIRYTALMMYLNQDMGIIEGALNALFFVPITTFKAIKGLSSIAFSSIYESEEEQEGKNVEWSEGASEKIEYIVTEKNIVGEYTEDS